MKAAVVREFRKGDEPALHDVFFSAVRQTAARDYTPEQLAAWAPADWDSAAWAQRIHGIRPFVAEAEGQPVGYADIQSNGYIDHFFVAASWARRGVGRLLMERIHREASIKRIPTLWSNVSLSAQPFFSRFGFCIVCESSAIIRGVSLPNARMEKHIEG